MVPNFTQSDAILNHLDAYVAGIADPFIQSRYTGFVAVTAVTYFEINVREKIFDFCRKKHRVFGDFSESHFEKTNAKIKLDDLRKEYLKKFGLRYNSRFNKKLDKIEAEHLRATGRGMKESYANLITWRHDFVHDGRLPAYATYGDARAAYDSGKLVIGAFFASLNR